MGDLGYVFLGGDSYYTSKMDDSRTPSVDFDLEDRPIVTPPPSRPVLQAKSSSSSSPTPARNNSPPKIPHPSRRCSTSHHSPREPPISHPTFSTNLTKCLPSPSTANTPPTPMTPKTPLFQTIISSFKKIPSSVRNSDASRR